MGFSWKNGSIGRPKIAEGTAVFIFLRDRFPKAETRRFAPVAYHTCHNLPRSTTHGHPHPPRLFFLLDKTPDFISFENIIRSHNFFHFIILMRISIIPGDVNDSCRMPLNQDFQQLSNLLSTLRR
jgi:hypothetical protein